jgi:hypothetical protein
MRGATMNTHRERRVGLWTAGAMIAAVLLAIAWQGDGKPERDGWKYLYGDTWTREHNGWIEYRYDDTGMVCRYRPTEWQKPECKEMTR